jgi:hypothetical protein
MTQREAVMSPTEVVTQERWQQALDDFMFAPASIAGPGSVGGGSMFVDRGSRRRASHPAAAFCAGL